MARIKSMREAVVVLGWRCVQGRGWGSSCSWISSRAGELGQQGTYGTTGTGLAAVVAGGVGKAVEVFEQQGGDLHIQGVDQRDHG
jgi:hypothetical protein